MPHLAPSSSLGSGPAPRPEPATPPTPRVLVAEDNPISQRVGLLVLRGLGYRPDVAGNGLEVLHALEGDTYDVIFMDVEMPEMDGMEATRRIRADLPAGRQPAIIAMTASTEAEDRTQCLEAGMDDHLTKPMRPEALTAVLAWWGPSRPRGVGAPPCPAAGMAAGAAEDAAQDAEAAPGRAEPAVDAGVFDTFATSIVGPDASARSQLIDTYLTDAGTRVADLLAGMAAHDIGAIGKAAHGLRSGSALFGALPLARLLQELETTARAGTADVQSMVDHVQVEFAAVVVSLDQIRAA